MGGGHKNDQIKCKSYDVEIEYEGEVIFAATILTTAKLRNSDTNNEISPYLLRSHEGND